MTTQTEAERNLAAVETTTRNIARTLGVLYAELQSQGLPEELIQALIMEYFRKLTGQ